MKAGQRQNQEGPASGGDGRERPEKTHEAGFSKKTLFGYRGDSGDVTGEKRDIIVTKSSFFRMDWAKGEEERYAA